MKIKVIREFKDAEHDLILRTVGEELKVTKERGRYLINFGVAKEIKDDDSATHAGPQN